MQQFTFTLQLLDDETLSNQLLVALAPETTPEPEAKEPETKEPTVPTEPCTEPTEPTETKDEEATGSDVKVEVKEEEDDTEWDDTKWWESKPDDGADDWYWEGVEEEVQEEEEATDDIEWMTWPPAPVPPKPIQPKKMPREPKEPRVPPPPMPREPDGSWWGKPKGVKAPWATKGDRDRAIRTDKYGGTI